MENIKAVIFDMDGVIINSEPVHLHSKKKILLKYGLDVNLDFNQYVGVANEKLWAELIAKFNLSAKVEELVLLQDDLNFQEICDESIGLSEGLLNLLQFLKGKNCIIAVASSSSRYFVNNVLKRFSIYDLFSFVLTGDDVENKKPNPEIYIKALQLLNLQPNEVIAIEDSKMGVKAATEAGIFCIGYENPTSGQQDLSLAKKRVKTLEDIIF